MWSCGQWRLVGWLLVYISGLDELMGFEDIR
jgi:hypothetical protein